MRPAKRWAFRWPRLLAVEVPRVLALVVTSALCAFMVVDFAATPAVSLQAGDVASYTMKAPFTLSWPDEDVHERQQGEARRTEPPVFVHSGDLVQERADAISRAFEAGRAALLPQGWTQGQPVPSLSPDRELEVEQAFLQPLRVQLREADVETLVRAGFPLEAEQLARELLRRAMSDHLIVISRDQLPHERGTIRVIHLTSGTVESEELVEDFQPILVPDEARQRITLGLLEADRRGAVEAASAELARALVTANLHYEALETEERQSAAADAVPLQWISVKRGQILFRAGEVVTQEDLAVYRQFQERGGERQWWVEVLSTGLFFVVLLATLHHFVVAWLGAQQARVRDLWMMGGLLALSAGFARLVVAGAESLVALVGYEAEPDSVWFAVPVAGTAMLARVLLGVGWALPFTVAAAVVCGLVMDQQALPVAFFVITGVAGASAVEQARERISVVRAGAWVGLVGAVSVLLIHLVQLFVVNGDTALATPMRPFWSMVFAMCGGLASAFLVLSLVPVLESLGYVTDYRMMELANLDHPLLRQLMLRAPGSYHHSVIVGSLAEAGATAIGANALLARVASYFHDIGKANRPQYFVENQQGGVNRHTHLDPFTSAHVIISHVVDGGAMAAEHRLPQPIIDNIYMHHGTGILQYFYEAAKAQAPDPSMLDEAAFRYPGPKPNTREAGIIMLADKVEAATRTLKVPDEQHIRSMIDRIVGSVIADGQFSDCPLTIAEIRKVTETFVTVLAGIYHQRIEYPSTADLSRASPAPPPALPEGVAVRPQSSQTPPEPDVLAPDEDTDVVDYESLDYLPRRG